MAVTRLEPDAVCEQALSSLGLDDAGVDLFSPEALAALVRRAASYLCPTPSRSLIRSLVEVLRGLPGSDDDLPDKLQTSVDLLVGVGDLLELPSEDPEERARRLYLGPPSFVRRASGVCLLLGVRADGEPLVTEELAQLVDFDGHLRMVSPLPDLDDLLASSGLRERDVDQWLHHPRNALAPEVIAEFEARLQAVGPSGDIEGAQILDPHSSVRFYRGRWRPLRSTDRGMFVARRPQAYGSDLWCVALVEDGQITRLVDLPVNGSLIRGADEAWRLQAAIDAALGHPQLVRVRSGTDSTNSILDLFSPLPAWAQRRLELLARPLLRGKGALFSYALPTGEVDEEVAFLVDSLWMSLDQPTDETGV